MSNRSQKKITFTQIQEQWPAIASWLQHASVNSTYPFRFPDISKALQELGLSPFNPVAGACKEPALPDVEPALKNIDTNLLTALQHALNHAPHQKQVAEWSEKLLRVGELRRLELKRRSRQSGETVDQGRNKILHLCLYFLEHFQFHGDPRYINLVLKILDQSWLGGYPRYKKWVSTKNPHSWSDAMLILIHVLLEHSLQIVAQDGWQSSTRLSCIGNIEPVPQLPMTKVFSDVKTPRVIVFSPNPYSLYTLAVLQLLDLHGVRVQGIVVRRLVNYKRFIQEFNRDGTRLIRKIWTKLFLRNNAYAPREYKTLPQYLVELGLTQTHVAGWAKDHDVKVWYCKSLNDNVVLAALRSENPHAVIFTGGGLINQSVLDAAGLGIINTHMGILPPYRGMDVVEWPILEGHSNQVGITVHFMTKGLDEGDILAMHYAPRSHTHDILQLRERMEVLSPQACVSATIRFLSGVIPRTPQSIPDGKQFFIIHPRMYDIALNRYKLFRASETV